ncbi:F-box/kelch-repeat protein [Arachis hypogaea]|nr:F-box/kelch-repeat protein [Arachis hypogaea]
MLPPELITQILGRLSVKHLGCVKSVSKLWNNLISNPNFANSHFELSLAPTHRCIFIPEVTIDHLSIDLDALSHATHAAAAAATITKIPPSPAANNDPDPDSDDHIVLGSCRGFIALYQYPHFFVI